MSNFKPCIIVPCYNHGHAVGATIERCLALAGEYRVILVDDGSEDVCAQRLDQLADANPRVLLERLTPNQGKGAAVAKGLLTAHRLGYSHAVQVDADGQHAIEDVPKMFAAAQQHPKAIISGKPIYDASVPSSRLYGRYITHVWVWIHTLSFAIGDSMCGFRVYPLAATAKLLNRHRVARRMDFDTDIIVRLFWQGSPVKNFDTAVTYPEAGVSHFAMLHDNLRISRTHARLFLGMLLRSPWYLPLRLIGKR